MGVINFNLFVFFFPCLREVLPWGTGVVNTGIEAEEDSDGFMCSTLSASSTKFYLIKKIMT